MYKEQRHGINALLELKNRIRKEQKVKEGYCQSEFEKGIAKGLETAIKMINTQINESVLFLYENNEISK